jgi:mannose-6-phosphate isomerase-like protein (cupin superfamily)
MQTVEEPGAKPPRHLHHREDETLYVIEGSLSMWVAGR